MKDYTVTINGVEHTMQLDDEDAKRYGDAAQPARKAADKPAEKAATVPANKARQSATK